MNVIDFKKFPKLIYLTATHPCLVSKRIEYNTRRTIADILSYFKYYKYPYRIIFLAGMALGGTNWMKQLLAGIPGYFTRVTPMPIDIAYEQDICDSAFEKVPVHGYALFKTHLNPRKENIDCLRRNRVEKILVTFRDLRDVAVSHYFRLLYFPKPKNVYDYKDYRLISKEVGLNELIEHTAEFYAPWIFGWYKIAEQMPDKIHFTKFEDLKNDTVGEFNKVLDFYGIDLPDKMIKKIVMRARGKGNMRKNLQNARILPDGQSSNFRSGKVGQWKTEFSEAQKKRSKELLGASLIKLGYEKDMNW